MIFKSRTPNKYIGVQLDNAAPSTSNAFNALQQDKGRTEHNCPDSTEEITQGVSHANVYDTTENAGVCNKTMPIITNQEKQLNCATDIQILNMDTQQGMMGP
ncbi:hypothetical protein FXO38_12276 [Capsicum annuum]|nr:hypothetical protein FXO38_12276 [Capsicum annuum]KAF3674922.1 hypothetical protein FXO37_06140 [Capsicum annuum]